MMASAVTDGDQKRSLTLQGVDPETCMIVFKNHWSQVVRILEKHEAPVRSGGGLAGFLYGAPSSSSSSSSSSGSRTFRLVPIPADEASAVQNYVEHILFLLMEEEAGQGGAMGPILEFVVMEGVMERLFLWSLRRQFTEDLKLEQLRMYQMLLSQARQPLLHHKPVLKPLMVLLSSCSGDGAGGCVEAELVLLLHQLCAALVRDPSVLELVFHTGEDQGAANFLLFSLLIPYTHRQGVVGQQARDALLLIMSLSASDPRVAQHIAQNTYFCPVLATGLSGLYSSLPAKLKVYSDDWHSLERADWLQVPSLVHFLHSLEFCCTVTKTAHPSIRTQLLGYIYNGFLVPVLAPALHKCTVEEVMTTTAYLDLFLRSISEPALLQTFLIFILLHTHDNVHILDTLVSRINTPFQLGTVSLALSRTLIGLYCEDVMLQLVLRYLIPCSHLSGRGRAALTDRDCYSSSAAAFLFLTPLWCPLRAAHTQSEHILWPKDSDDPLSDDIVGYSRVIGSEMLIDSNYLHYLRDARLAVSASHRACSVWSAPYDGRRPPPRPVHSREEEEEEEEEEEQSDEERKGTHSEPSSSPPPPPLAASSSDTVSLGDRAGRGSGAELEWDDMFQEDSVVAAETNGVVPPPAPPPHIQEMRRSAVLLLRGSAYIEEADFQDDVRVYDLVARSNGASPRRRQRQRERAGPSGRTVSDIMSSHRQAQRKRSQDILAQPVAKQLSTHTDQEEEKEEEEEERKDSVNGGVPVVNGSNSHSHTHQDTHSHRHTNQDTRSHRHTNQDTHSHTHQDTHSHTHQNTHSHRHQDTHSHRHTHQDTHSHRHTHQDTNSHTHQDTHSHRHPHRESHSDTPLHSGAPVTPDPSVSVATDPGFLSQYRELMLALGEEPDCDDLTCDMGSFRRRVGALREKQEEEVRQEVDMDWSTVDRSEEEEDVEGEEEDAEERKRSDGVPFTGPFLSVLLSRLENLLENPIPVNLLVTGILSRLAAYPQPLLRSFLLQTHTAPSQPAVHTLYQVLVSLRCQIEQYAASHPDFPALVREAWRFLLARDEDLRIRESVLECPGGGGGGGGGGGSAAVPPCPHISPQVRGRVFATVLYAEFLKELAAIAQEHSIVPE